MREDKVAPELPVPQRQVWPAKRNFNKPVGTPSQTFTKANQSGHTFCAQATRHHVSPLSGSCEDQVGLVQKTILVQFHLWKQIPEEFSMRSERPQSSTLRQTPPQCVPATTAPFSLRSCYRLLQNSPTFKHGEETKLAQCLHHPRNTTPLPTGLVYWGAKEKLFRLSHDVRKSRSQWNLNTGRF